MQSIKAGRLSSINGKLYFSILLPFFFVITAIIIVLGIGGKYFFEHSRRDLEDLQTTIFKKTQNEIDVRLQNIKNIAGFLSDHPFTAEVSRISESTPWDRYTYVELKEIILELKELSVETTLDIAIYFNQSDSIVANRRFSSENLMAYSGRFGLTAEEFRKICFLPSMKSTYRIIASSVSEEPMLMYLQPVLDQSFKQVGTVVVALPLAFFNKSLGFENGGENGLGCYMFNAADSLCIGGSPDYTQKEISALIDEMASGAARGSAKEPQIYSADGYIITSIPSSDVFWRYYFFTSSDDFYGKYIVYVLTFTVAVAAAIFIGLFFSSLFASRTYKAIKRIIPKFDKRKNTFRKTLANIEQMMNTYQNSWRSYQRLQEDHFYQCKDRFLLEMCRGELTQGQ